MRNKSLMSLVGLFGIVFLLSSCGGKTPFTNCIDSAVDPLSGGFQAGTGTEADPYIICTAEQLNLIGADGALDLKSYRLEADIDLSGIKFNIIGTSGISWFQQGIVGIDEVGFRGVFDGNNKKISNLFILNIDSRLGTGLIGVLGVGGVVKNLGLENVDISGKANVGGLASFNVGVITNCYTTGAVSGTEQSIGGLVGSNHDDSTRGSTLYRGAIEHSYSSCDVNGDSTSVAIGGLVGKNNGTIESSYSVGEVLSLIHI